MSGVRCPGHFAARKKKPIPGRSFHEPWDGHGNLHIGASRLYGGQHAVQGDPGLLSCLFVYGDAVDNHTLVEPVQHPR